MEPAFEFVGGERASFSTGSAFEPHPLLRNPHLATAVAACWPRNCSRLSVADDRYFDVEPGTKLLAKCNWQESRKRHPTLILIHGFEGSSESPYMLGTGEKAFQAGFNVLRINQRNCGGTEHLTPTLHSSGLSNDYRGVLEELISEDALREVFFVGYSVGGNLVLKMAGELGSDTPKELRAVCAVSPCLDMASCSTGSGAPRNFLYERYVLRCIRNSQEKKAKLFPERYCVDGLPAVHTLHGWHDAVVAPAWGYRDAAEYYRSASAPRGWPDSRSDADRDSTGRSLHSFRVFLRPRHHRKPVYPAHCPRAWWTLCLYFKHRRPGAILGRIPYGGVLREPFGALSLTTTTVVKAGDSRHTC